MTPAPPQPSRRRLGVGADHHHYKWWALTCTSLGMLLAAANNGTLIIALPNLERALHASLLALVWVILAYMIAATVLVLSAGRLSDLFGRKRAYVAGFLVFAVASLGAGFAGDATVLILWRILQGIGSAFLFANAPALVTDAFPSRQLGLAMGANMMVMAVGLVIGPVLGGALVAISWPWVFWFNVPFALIGALWGALVLRELAQPDKQTGYDLLGTATFVLGLTGLALGVSNGGLSGWGQTLTLVSLAAAMVLIPAWLAIERRSAAPMLDLRLFANRLFAAASGAAFLNGLARFALMFVFVFYFQGAQGASPLLAGIELTPLALGMLIASPIAGSYADRHGSRGLAAAGMLVTGAGLMLMTLLQVHTPYWETAIFLAIVGVGSGMFNSPNTAAIMGAVPAQRRGIAAGSATLLMQTGAVISIAFVMAVITAQIPKATLFAIFSGLTKGLSAAKLDPFIANMHHALWALTAVAALGVVVCLLRPRGAAHAARQPATAPAPAGVVAAEEITAGALEPVPADEAIGA